MLVKRFQEIFSSKRCPREVLPAFFSTPLFGRLENLVLPSKMDLLPKITERGERNPTLNSLTAHPSSWRFLMKEIDDSGPKCYRPRSKSASSDAIFRVYRSSMHITVGVAAKNYDVETPFGYPCLARECSVYNKMFFRAPRAQRSNILIICATNYIAAMKSQFEGKNFMIFTDARYKHIDEIIVLDLSSKQNLADFFGLNDDNHTLETIQDVLKKVVTLQSDDDDEASDILKSWHLLQKTTLPRMGGNQPTSLSMQSWALCCRARQGNCSGPCARSHSDRSTLRARPFAIAQTRGGGPGAPTRPKVASRNGPLRPRFAIFAA